MERVSRLQTVIEYGLIIALYYVAGGAFSYTNYSTQIILLFLVSLIICLVRGKQHYVLRRKVFTPWMAMSFFILLVPLLNGGSFSTYIAIIMQLGIGVFCASIIPPERFKSQYINIIVFFAVISLIGFLIGLVAPGIALRFPVTEGDASVDYYNAGIYVFMRSKGYAAGVISLMKRNAGICWEPGCYQAFLNIGLLFLLNQEAMGHQTNFYLKFLILVVTIVTTVSTTGILILLFLLVIYYPTWRKGLKGGWICVPAVFILIFWIYNATAVGEVLQYKISRELSENNVLLERISLDKITYMFSDVGIPYLLGMSFEKWVAMDEPLWNSIIHSFLCLGIPFTLIQLTGYWKGGKQLINKKGVLFFVMIMCASTETLFWRVFFSTIAFYGWIGSRDDVYKVESKKNV